jgi:hypothetical protein
MKLLYIILNILIFASLLQLKLDWKESTNWSYKTISSQKGVFDNCSIYSTRDPKKSIYGNAKIHTGKALTKSAIIIEVIRKHPQSFFKIVNVDRSKFCNIDKFLDNNLGCLLKIPFTDLIHIDLKEVTNGIMLVFYFKSGGEIYEGKIIFNENLADGLRKNFIDKIYSDTGLLDKRKEFLNEFSRLVEELNESFEPMYNLRIEFDAKVNNHPDVLQINKRVNYYQAFFDELPGLLDFLEDFLKEKENRKLAERVNRAVARLVNDGKGSVVNSDKVKSIAKQLKLPLKEYNQVLRKYLEENKIKLVLTNYLNLQKWNNFLTQETAIVKQSLNPEGHREKISEVAALVNPIFKQITAMCFETDCTVKSKWDLSDDESSNIKVRRLNEYIKEQKGRLEVAEQSFVDYMREGNGKIVLDNSYGENYIRTGRSVDFGGQPRK